MGSLVLVFVVLGSSFVIITAQSQGGLPSLTVTPPPQQATPYEGVIPPARTARQDLRLVRQECKFSRRGTSYAGRAARTVSGLMCQRWDSQLPRPHTFYNTDVFPDRTIGDATNYCRNPDNKAFGPWCFTTSGDVTWEYCDVPLCHCKTSRSGTEYLGNIHRTSSGKPCQSWSSQTPHQHSYTPASFPEDTLEDARNYCRNPDGEHPEGPWCLTVEGAVRWEYCDVPFCDCKPDSAGLEYAGQRSVTTSSYTCQRWDQQSPQPHNYNNPAFFPDASLTETGNYCRNPDRSEGGGPWCYTTNPDVRWEYCDVTLCELPHGVNEKEPIEGGVITEESPTDCLPDPLGLTYTGAVSVTTSGRACQAWSAQAPHRHGYGDAAFPDARVSDAGSACRNVERDPGGPWCYTQDPDVRWEYCDIPLCAGALDKKPQTTTPPQQKVDNVRHECKRSPSGTDYRGTQNRTTSGLTCAPWSEQTQRSDAVIRDSSFPYDNLLEARNFCRNPSGSRARPWCYTSEPSTAWEFCDVPDCGCKKEPHGRDYDGAVSITTSGLGCQSWSAQVPHRHQFTDAAQFPDRSVMAAGSSCRNPDDAESGGPWCYTQDPAVRWEYCHVDACDCVISGRGTEYAGPRSVTRDGLACQAWSAQAPHQHAFTDASQFPDPTLEGAGNSCRNPNGDEESPRPWCYTATPGVRWQYCDIPPCESRDQQTLTSPAVTINPQECLRTVAGHAYTGTKSVTTSGAPCQAWSQQVPQPHSYTTADHFPDSTIEGASNYCRNPDVSDSVGVWCYTTNSDVRWEYCDVPLCPDVTASVVTSTTQQKSTTMLPSVSEKGVTTTQTSTIVTTPHETQGCKIDKTGSRYRGRLSVTRSGRKCQRWSSQSPHSHRHSDVTDFPDVSLDDADNFCRNPGRWQPEGPWCLTSDPAVRWEYCDVPACECKSTTDGRKYGGRRTTTISGRECQRWDSQTPHAHRNYDTAMFPDTTIEGAANFCRSPDEDMSGGPWCYTMDLTRRWEYCDVTLCEGVTPEPDVDTGAVQAAEMKDDSLPGGSLAAIILGTLLMVLVVLVVLVVFRYRAHLPLLTKTASHSETRLDSSSPGTSSGSLGLTFYNNKQQRKEGVLYLDRPQQQVDERCIDKMSQNEYMTIPFDKDAPATHLPTTIM